MEAVRVAVTDVTTLEQQAAVDTQQSHMLLILAVLTQFVQQAYIVAYRESVLAVTGVLLMYEDLDLQTVVFVRVVDIEEKLIQLGVLVVLLLTIIVMHRVTQTATLLLVVIHKHFQQHQDTVTVTHKKYIKEWRQKLQAARHKVLDSAGLSAVAGAYHTEQVDKVL